MMGCPWRWVAGTVGGWVVAEWVDSWRWLAEWVEGWVWALGGLMWFEGVGWVLNNCECVDGWVPVPVLGVWLSGGWMACVVGVAAEVCLLPVLADGTQSRGTTWARYGHFRTASKQKRCPLLHPILADASHGLLLLQLPLLHRHSHTDDHKRDSQHRRHSPCCTRHTRTRSSAATSATAALCCGWGGAAWQCERDSQHHC